MYLSLYIYIFIYVPLAPDPMLCITLMRRSRPGSSGALRERRMRPLPPLLSSVPYISLYMPVLYWFFT